MKKALVILTVLAVSLAYSTLAMAAGTPDVHMNVRFMHNTNGSTENNRWSLHVVELTASQEIENIGANLIYRLNDAGATGDYPVNANVYIKSGPHKLTAGLQFVPFALYKFNNLYMPLVDIPGQMGQCWDFDWGFVYSYDAKPILINAGWMDNGAEIMTAGEQAESNTIVGRFGYDILSTWNIGVSYLNEAGTGDRTKYAVDTTWEVVPNLTTNAQYVVYEDHYSVADAALVANNSGKYGSLQLKYDILKVPAPIDGVSLVAQYSFDDSDTVVAPSLTGNKVQNFQEEIIVNVAENLTIFWQFVQEKRNDPNGVGGIPVNKYHYLAVKYNLF